jgi:hypothetical protein
MGQSKSKQNSELPDTQKKSGSNLLFNLDELESEISNDSSITSTKTLFSKNMAAFNDENQNQNQNENDNAAKNTNTNANQNENLNLNQENNTAENRDKNIDEEIQSSKAFIGLDFLNDSSDTIEPSDLKVSSEKDSEQNLKEIELKAEDESFIEMNSNDEQKAFQVSQEIQNIPNVKDQENHIDFQSFEEDNSEIEIESTKKSKQSPQIEKKEIPQKNINENQLPQTEIVAQELDDYLASISESDNLKSNTEKVENEPTEFFEFKKPESFDLGNLSQSKELDLTKLASSNQENNNLNFKDPLPEKKIVNEEIYSHSPKMSEQNRDYVELINLKESEIHRLGSLIRGLREDREVLIHKLTELEKSDERNIHEIISLKSELEEIKIDFSMLKQNSMEEVEQTNYKLRILKNKRDTLIEINKELKNEVERMKERSKIDVVKIKQREQDLESKLEMLKIDSASQIESRDKKISELKRKVEMLEFDIEATQSHQQKYKELQSHLQNKIDLIQKTLKASLGVIENDEAKTSEINHHLVRRVKF